ncbi:diguanylate cyclase [Bacillus lacus]|uniref:Diguanylate cyclase n=1 Tax=Metabacillus lacus TaxID=1983721 RepID=A0A7X2LYS2_9BACI|nr:GGDEF domain-containing protein [Metabacillus lacus]MRX73865.1 diguanylate cyclase [Metabacillus lacus]
MNSLRDITDYKTEKIFSWLRWIFLALSVFMFYYPPVSSLLELEVASFPLLISIGILYMSITQFSLGKMEKDPISAKWLTWSGILFDFTAFVWLLILSGGSGSPFIPIAYLIVMHAAIYWKAVGALVSSAAVTASYSVIFLGEPYSWMNTFRFLSNISFLWIIGLFGALIVLRERSHLQEKQFFQKLVSRDYLTGLYNHRSFQEEIKKLKEERAEFILLMGDIDFFKRVNDEYGHTMGDAVLQQLGKVLGSQAELMGGRAFRYGGEELALIFSDRTLEQAEAVIEELYKKLGGLHLPGNFTVSMSFGVAGAGGKADEDVVNRADALLYRAKHSGRGRALLENGKVLRMPVSRHDAM